MYFYKNNDQCGERRSIYLVIKFSSPDLLDCVFAYMFHTNSRRDAQDIL